jgi:DNA-binding beta-propeller fold protein YncE
MVGGCESSQSVNTTRNVLIACYESMKIQEYTTVGSLVREVRLGDGCNPFHAIQLPSGQLIVSHNGTLHRVIVVGLDSQVIRSYGNTRGLQPGQLSNPCGIALFSKQGCVLVAEHNNNRIVALSSSLSDARQLPLSADGGIKYPRALCLDESRDRLYVADGYGQSRVLVFDKVTNMDAMFER